MILGHIGVFQDVPLSIQVFATSSFFHIHDINTHPKEMNHDVKLDEKNNVKRVDENEMSSTMTLSDAATSLLLWLSNVSLNHL